MVSSNSPPLSSGPISKTSDECTHRTSVRSGSPVRTAGEAAATSGSASTCESGTSMR